MADKHKSITHLKILILLMSEALDDRDWDLIDEHLEHVKIYIGNDIANFRSTLKQTTITFSSGDNKPIVPKTAEAVFSCAFCKATGPASEGDKHQCDEGAMAAALKRRCIKCGGYIADGEHHDAPGELFHKDPLQCEPPLSDVITDEAKQLPDLTKKLPEYLCFYCGDGFHERGHFVNHLTTTHGIEEVTLIAFQLSTLGEVEPDGTPIIRTHLDDYTREQVYTALNLGPEKFLWRWSEGAFDWCSTKDMLVPFRDGERWYVMKEKFLPEMKYHCLFCACELACDDVDVTTEGDIICHSCEKPSCSTCQEPIENAVKGKKGKLLCEGCNEKKKAEKAAAKLAKKSSSPEVTTH